MEKSTLGDLEGVAVLDTQTLTYTGEWELVCFSHYKEHYVGRHCEAVSDILFFHLLSRGYMLHNF